MYMVLGVWKQFLSQKRGYIFQITNSLVYTKNREQKTSKNQLFN